MFKKGFLKKTMTAAVLSAGLMLPVADAQANYGYTSMPPDGYLQTIVRYGGDRGYVYGDDNFLAPTSSDPVDVLLVLVIDGSSSMSAEEFKIQLDIMAQAIMSEKVQGAWFGYGEERERGAIRSLGMTVVDFGCEADIRIPWVDFRHDDPYLEDRLFAFANEITALNDARDASKSGCTYIGEMLMFTKDEVFANAPWDVKYRSVVDVISDGKNITGGKHSYEAPLQSQRQALAEAGITINALAIANEQPDLDVYYDENLRTQAEDIPLGGRAQVGRTWAIARNMKESDNDTDDLQDFAEEAETAFRAKLIWEVAQIESGENGVSFAEMIPEEGGRETVQPASFIPLQNRW